MRKIALLFRDGHYACRFVFLLSGVGRLCSRADGCGGWRRRAVADSRIIQPIAKRYTCGLGNATPVASVMGVNKFASCCGTLTATGQYLRRIPVPWKMLLPAAALAFAASYLGSKTVVYFPVQYMKPAMLVIMIAMCLYTFLKKDLGQTARTEKLTRRETLWGLFFGALIGFYDGVFGPGTGSLLAFVFVRFYGYDFLAANASAKVINWTIKNGMLLR